MNKLIGAADYCGMTVSAACLLHCLGVPLLLVLFPALGLAGDDDAFHRTMAVMVAVPALLALLPGFLRHRSKAVVLSGMAGLACFSAAMLVVEPLYGEAAELVLAIIGGALLFFAHMRNLRSCRCCNAKTV